MIVAYNDEESISTVAGRDSGELEVTRHLSRSRIPCQLSLDDEVLDTVHLPVGGHDDLQVPLASPAHRAVRSRGPHPSSSSFR